jgi:hypothetical protein
LWSAPLVLRWINQVSLDHPEAVAACVHKQTLFHFHNAIAGNRKKIIFAVSAEWNYSGSYFDDVL